MNLPVIYVNGDLADHRDIIDRLWAFRGELTRFSEGKLTCTWDILDYRMPVRDGMLTQDQAYKIADDVYREDLKPYRYLFMVYPRNPNSTFLASYSYPKLNCAITTMPNSFNSRGMVFEFGHQMQKFYNDNRGDLPKINIEDFFYPTDEAIKKKIMSMVPYARSILGG